MSRPPALRLACLLAIAVATGPAVAATCTWNAPTGAWSAISNWSGCADAPGPSTRTPGLADVALITSGAASFDVDATVAELEIGSGASLTLVGGGVRTLTVATALRLAGGTLSTTGNSSYPFLRVILDAGGLGEVLATSTLSNTVEFENRGDLQLSSNSGTALNIRDLSRLINTDGSSLAIGGGDARVHLDGPVPLSVHAGAILHTSGDVYIGKSIVAPGAPRVESAGIIDHVGPGTLTLGGLASGGGNAATLQVEGMLSINAGTLACDQAADTCRMQSGSSGLESLHVQLANGVLDFGAPSANGLSINEGGQLSGTGVINGSVNLRGRLVPGADAGPAHGTIAIGGDLLVNTSGRVEIDLGGGTPGTHDQVDVGGALGVGGTGAVDGRGTLQLRFAGFQPAFGVPITIASYGSAPAQSAWYRIHDNSPLHFAARFDAGALQVFSAPLLTLDEVAVTEGNSGTSTAALTLRLSQPFAQAVSGELRIHDGTASSGPPPSGDFLFPDGLPFEFPPGTTELQKSIVVHGDTMVEGDEAFSAEITRNTLANAALANDVPGSPRAHATILTDDLPPDTRFVLAGKDISGNQVRRYTSTGTFIDAWGPNIGNFQNYVTTGMCFSPDGNILATRFGYSDMTYYSAGGAILDDAFARPPGSGSYNLPESCVFDRSGNVYVGQAGASSSDDEAVAVMKFDRHGNALDRYAVPTGPRGTDWIELAGDQCTLYYTSEDTSVRRYNLCTRTPLPDFAIDLTPPYCYALRLRPNGELMVACQDAVHRLSPQGLNMQTYTRQDIGELDAGGLFALNLDPDGTSFWTAGVHSGYVYRVDIESGSVLANFSTGTGGVSGLAVYDELGDGRIFADGFDPDSAPEPVVATGPSSHLFKEHSRCERQFAPRKATMPHYVPHDIALIVMLATDCEG